jgi:hypothetical protein
VNRLARSATVVTALAPLSDAQLADRLREWSPGHHGIGGATGTLDVDGVTIFVKQVPVTAPELAAPRSTANLFGLPPLYQYALGQDAVGSLGFGAWRELATHELTTSWVQDGRFSGFPLLYHWRLLPRPERPERPERDEAELERQVAAWDGSDAVRRRVVAVAEAPAVLVLFMEHWPTTAHTWLQQQVAADGGATAIEQVDRQLEAAVRFFDEAGLVHFDVHFENVLTDGEEFVFTDFGLSGHDRFDLDPDEAAFLARHRPSPVDPGYDRAYARGYFARWLVAEFLNAFRADATAVLADVAAGKDVGLPPAAATVLDRDAPLALVMNEFFHGLRTKSRSTPYPAEALRRTYRPA